MPDTSSVFSRGSGGGTFEGHVQAAFLVTMITQGRVPCIPAAEIEELAFQATRLGYATDDLLVRAKVDGGTEHRMLFQLKYNVTISANNDTFRDVMSAFWLDYNNASLFNPALDRLVIVKSGLNEIERNHTKVLLNWAKHKTSSQDFFLEVNRIQVKKERLQVLTDVLATVNNGTPLTDDEVWQFLRCVELLDYDFVQTGSVDESNVLSLLNLAKSEDATADARAIWNDLLALASHHNLNGGSITSTSIREQPVYQQFNLRKLVPAYQALHKLQSNGQAILLPMKNTLGGYRLSREDVKARITKSINKSHFTIVAGAAGVGKSALVRDWLTEQLTSDAFFVFRADQFNKPHLSQVFTEQGVGADLADLFACLALLPQKTLVIDSAEKLLEGDPENAFKQLLAFISAASGSRINVVLTCRRYAVDLIVHKFGITTADTIDIPQLDDDEISQLSAAVPGVRRLLVNPNITSLLRSLKYLDLAVTLTQKTEDDLSGVSLTGFKDKLWQHLVENIEVRGQGMPLKRKRAFLGIAVQRAQRMTLFVEPVGVSEEAVEALENDGIIFREANNQLFAPSHDVLEDLALVKFINEQWESTHNAQLFFAAIGNEPALRRSFRLWVEDQLLEESQEVLRLIGQAHTDQNIENYWLDEMLIAVFRSANCERFFAEFEPVLLLNEAALLRRSVHLIRTACRQSPADAPAASTILHPIGSGWSQMLTFISRHFANLQAHRLLITGLITDWAANLNGVHGPLPAEAAQVKDMLLLFVNQIEQGDPFWQTDPIKSVTEQLVIVLFKLVQLAQTEISDLLQRASTPRVNGRDYRVSCFYEVAVENCLSGLFSAPLCKYLPADVIHVANTTWKLKPQEDADSYRRGFRYDREEQFGLKEHLRNCFPSGIYKAPVLLLLRYSMVEGLQFVVDFANYCASSYHQSIQDDDDETLEEVVMTTADGEQIEQFGNSLFWSAHRGTVVTSDVLHTVLMSTEQYLLELCEYKTNTSRDLLQICFRFLLENSESVLLTGVLASITQAYSAELGTEWLALLTARQCFKWDMERRLHEASVLSPADQHLPFAQKVTYTFNKLPHRTAYSRGLVDFLIAYQMNHGEFNEQIRAIIAKHYADPTEDDFVWRKMLNEIDLSKWEIEEVPDQPNQLAVRPTYDEPVRAEIENYTVQAAPEHQILNGSSWIHQVLDGRETTESDFNEWLAIYAEYTRPGRANHYLQRTAGLAIVGLRHFAPHLSDEQRAWSIQVLVTNIEGKLTAARRYYERDDFPGITSVLDTEHYLKSFCLLFDHTALEEDRLHLLMLSVKAITSHLGDHELDYIFEHFRNDVADKHPNSYSIVWKAVVAYAVYAKETENSYDISDQASVTRFKAAEDAFLLKLTCDPAGIDIDPSSLSFDTSSTWVLPKALAIIPYNTTDESQTQFMTHLCELVMLDARGEDDSDYGHSRSARRSQKMAFKNSMCVWVYFSHSLVQNTFAVSSRILDIMVTMAISYEPPRYRGERDDLKLVNNTLEWTISHLDTLVANSGDNDLNNRCIVTFWALWNFLLERIQALNSRYFARYLLLDIPWKPEATSWLPLDSAADFYLRAIRYFGSVKLLSTINVLASIGDRTLLPDALMPVVAILKAEPSQQAALQYPNATQLVERLYHRHMLSIKGRRRLLLDFIWLLDIMVDAGISKAYLIRENVITYKLQAD